MPESCVGLISNERVICWRLRSITCSHDRNLKVMDVLCALRLVRVVHFSIADTTNAICCAWPWLPLTTLSVTLTGVCGGVDLTSPSIKRNLNVV